MVSKLLSLHCDGKYICSLLFRSFTGEKTQCILGILTCCQRILIFRALKLVPQHDACIIELLRDCLLANWLLAASLARGFTRSYDAETTLHFYCWTSSDCAQPQSTLGASHHFPQLSHSHPPHWGQCLHWPTSHTLTHTHAVQMNPAFGAVYNKSNFLKLFFLKETNLDEAIL